MSGRLLFDGPPAGPHEHLTFAFDDGSCLRFVDPRRFGMLDLAPTAALHAHPRLAGLGLEPLDAGFDGPALAAALAGRQTALKVALMDQRRGGRGRQHLRLREPVPGPAVAAADRRAACGRARPRGWPRRSARCCWRRSTAGGSSLRDYVQADGELGFFQERFAVYGLRGPALPRVRRADPSGSSRPAGRPSFAPRCQR